MLFRSLALAYVGGDNRAFDLLLSRNEVKLFSYILFVVHDEDLALSLIHIWYVMAMTECLDAMPKDYARRGEIITLDVYKRQILCCSHPHTASRLTTSGILSYATTMM